MSSSTRRRVLAIAGWCVATALIALAATKVDWPRATRILESAKPWWLVGGVVANAGILLAWAAFWKRLLPEGEPRVTYRRMLEVVSVTSALMNTVPFGGGHASAIVTLNRRASTSTRGALSILALDQLGEGLSKVALFLVVMALVPLPPWMRASIATISLVVALWLLVLALGSRWANELGLLKRPLPAASALGCVIAMKVCQAVGMALVQRAFGVELSIGGTSFALAAVILGTLLPLAPGNLGTFEASAYLAYHYLGVPSEQALGVAIAQHVCFMLPAVGFGYGWISTYPLRAYASPDIV